MSVRCVSLLAKQGRQFSAVAGAKKLPPPSEKFKKLQERFQRDDGLPVHLKGGAIDNVYYQLTTGLCVAGTVWAFYEIYSMAMPKKQ